MQVPAQPVNVVGAPAPAVHHLPDQGQEVQVEQLMAPEEQVWGSELDSTEAGGWYGWKFRNLVCKCFGANWCRC